MIKRLEKIKSIHIISFVALALVTVFLAGKGYEFASETAARKSGAMEKIVLNIEDFEPVSLVKTGNGYKSTDHDSQFIIDLDAKVSTMKFTMTYTVVPGEVVFYYKEPGDNDFSAKKRRWLYPDDSTENGYIAKMPMKDVISIRIDPTMFAGSEMTFGQIILNEEKTFTDYFRVEYSDVFNLILYTAVISACLKYGVDFLLKKWD